MILTCERCSTRFRLDESRLPTKGARVRCSRCKHAFLVKPPGVTAAAVIDQLAAEAVRTAKPRPPEAAWDLDESAEPETTQQRAPRREQVEPPSEVEDESEWRFEGEVPELGDSGASLDLPNGEAPTPPSEPDSNESSFAQLGDPESWDLLSSSGDAVSAAGLGARMPAAPPQAAAPVAAVERTSAAPAAQEPREEEAETIEAPPRVVVIEPEPRLRALGIAATALLAALILAAGLRPTPHQVDSGATIVGPYAVEKLRVRVVDNAWVGPLWVVSGELRRASREVEQPPGVGPVALLLDAAGTPIEGGVAWAQPALDATRLQLEDPAELGAAAAAATLVERVSAPDARVAFDAVLEKAPSHAARFALDSRPLPRPPVARRTTRESADAQRAEGDRSSAAGEPPAPVAPIP